MSAMLTPDDFDAMARVHTVVTHAMAQAARQARAIAALRAELNHRIGTDPEGNDIPTLKDIRSFLDWAENPDESTKP